MEEKHCTIVAESNAPTPEPNRVDRTSCNMSNKSRPGEAVVWESFCETATSVATSIDCCKTSVQVTHGMVSDSSIILLKVLVPRPRAPISTFFSVRFFVFEGIFTTSKVTSNVWSAIAAVIVLHIALGMYIFRAYSDTSKSKAEKDDKID
ncbi:hypothetical protein Trydic_g9816 [Trypoxylus dichotomus]